MKQKTYINYKTTELCKLAYKYGVDKCPRLKHTYTPFYYELLKDKRKSIKKVLEMGVGNYLVMEHVQRIKGSYQRGASLYMWREFFPNAQIYGADILPEVMFVDERITTFVCDQTDRNDLARLIKNTGADVDLFIDDGSHHSSDQIFTCQNLMPLLKKDVIYIIEDVKFPQLVVGGLRQYECCIPNISRRYHDDRLVLVRNK